MKTLLTTLILALGAAACGQGEGITEAQAQPAAVALYPEVSEGALYPEVAPGALSGQVFEYY